LLSNVVVVVVVLIVLLQCHWKKPTTREEILKV